MASKKELLGTWKLYVIADAAAARGRDLAPLVERAIEGGADAIQYRDKSATDARMVQIGRSLREITRRHGIPFIVNDRVGVAYECEADGVHLGQEDAPLFEARRVLGRQALIGRSTHSPEQARAAETEGFDYIGVGPVFATPTKPDYVPAGLGYVEFAAQNLKVPFVAIGGIDETNVGQVVRAGAKAVAVVRAVIGADDPKIGAEKLIRAFDAVQMVSDTKRANI